MNFSTVIRLNPDGKWGARDKNGTWNGIIQTIQSKKGQLGLSDLTIMKSRSEVTFLIPYLRSI